MSSEGTVVGSAVRPGTVCNIGPSMPLSFLKVNEGATVVKVSGRENTKKFLEDLGFIQGTMIRVVTHVKGSVIVDIMGSKIAIDANMASKIMCSPAS
ncbi:MAG: ferrous iron transport protein A [Candidatus Methanomethylophilaceae archaeon]|nr:ferrous iron transport protein A [Candidatus Methanomethylophilaceae archaeon]